MTLPVALATLIAGFAQALPPEAQGQVVELPLTDGDRQRVLYLAPQTARASLVMLPGGTGDIGLAPSGVPRRDRNVLVRTRQAWVARGYAVVIPDAPDGTSLRGLRSTPAYAAAVAALVAFARSKADAPVFLIGTSQGSIAAMNGAAHAAPGTVAGVVLTESVSRLGASHETVFSADPQEVRVPALIVANRDDTCFVAPPQDAPAIAAALTQAPSVDVLHVAGGTTGVGTASGPCGPLSPHGYYGIEPQVIEQIAAWLAAHG